MYQIAVANADAAAEGDDFFPDELEGAPVALTEQGLALLGVVQTGWGVIFNKDGRVKASIYKRLEALRVRREFFAWYSRFARFRTRRISRCASFRLWFDIGGSYCRAK